MTKSVTHLHNIKVNDNYGTPIFLFVEKTIEYNVNPVFDYFASKQNHVTKKYWTKKNNAFEKNWKYDGFINPPYSIIADVMKKAYEEHLKNNITLMILTYNKTDTAWWHEYVEDKAEVHFHKGRIKFLDKDGHITKNSAPYPSVWIIYRGC